MAGMRAPEDNAEYQEFFDAACEGNLKRLEAALLPSLDINALESHVLQGRGALHIAARMGNVEKIHFLLAHGAEVDLRDSEYETPLHNAAFRVQPEAITVLLDNGANIHLRTGDASFTTLQNVLKYKSTVTPRQIKTIELLLDRGADINAEDGWGSNIVEHASTSHSIELLRLLIERGANLKNALPYAVRDHDMVEYLLSQGAKIIGPSAESSAITYAASSGNLDILRMILPHANETDLDGSRDAIIEAAAAGHQDMTNFLIEKGFNVNTFVKDCYIGQTPLLALFYLKTQSLQVITTLLENGANPSVQSSKGDTPLHEAALWSKPEAVQLLLNAGANTALRNHDGDTPLIKLASRMSGFCLNYHNLDGRSTNPRLETFEMVLRHTEEINVQNKKGETALHALAENENSSNVYMAKGRMEAAKLLVRKGADIGILNGDGKTAGDLFVQNERNSIFRDNAEFVQLLGMRSEKPLH